jgi:hypothetical protein
MENKEQFDDFFSFDETEEERIKVEEQHQKEIQKVQEEKDRWNKILEEIGYQEKPVTRTCFHCAYANYVDDRNCHGCDRPYPRIKCDFVTEMYIAVDRDAVCNHFTKWYAGGKIEDE